MEQEQATIVDQLLNLVEQVIRPNWGDLIAFVPLIFVLLIGGFLAFNAWQWRRASRRNNSRVPRPLRAGAPPPGVHLPGPSRWPFVLPIGAALLLFALVLPPRDDAGQASFPFNVPLLLLGLGVTALAVGGWLIDAMREWRATAQGAHAGEAPAATLYTGTVPLAAIPETVPPVRVAPPEPPPGVHMPGPSPWPFFAPIGITLIFFGLILNPLLVVFGLLLSVVAAVGWYREASHEYRSTEAVGHAVPKTRDPERAWPRGVARLFAVVAALGVVLATAPLWLPALGGLLPAPVEPGESPVGVPETPEITARTAVSFETDTLVVPCCQPFQLVFHNEHESVPHDVAITAGEGGEMLFNGDEITGPETITYDVPELDEGEYYFLCTVHPNMNGTVEAQPAP